MRYIAIILAFLLTSLGHGQNKSSIFLGDGTGSAPTFDSDSMGVTVPLGEIVIGTGSKAPGSSDSLFWNAGLFVDAPVNFSALAAGAVDSLLYIDASGFVGKTVVVANTNIYNTNGTLTGNRIIDGDGNSLSFQDNSVIEWLTEGSEIHLLANNFIGLTFTTMSAIDIGFVSGAGVNVFAATLVDINAPDIYLDAPDIFLEDALTLSTWDSILVRHPVTGEIQARLASTIAGSDSLGRNGTAGQIVFETATKAPNSEAELFYNSTTNRLSLGAGTSPGRALHIEVTTASTGDGITVDNNSASGYASVLFLNDGSGSGGFFYNGTTQASYAGAGSMNVIQVSNAPATLGTSNTVRLWVAGGGGVSLGSTAPATSAKLDIQGTNGALLLPRLTTAQRDALTGVNGMIIFNSTTGVIEGYEGGAWVNL